jgi:hypothetical protein
MFVKYCKALVCHETVGKNCIINNLEQ